MHFGFARLICLSASVVIVFAGVVLVLLNAMPGSLRQVDYLVIGAVATFSSMLVLFLALAAVWGRIPGFFVKRRGTSS